MRDAHSLTRVVPTCRAPALLRRPRGLLALARQTRLALALACVAEGFVERAVGAFGRVGEDAGDDELRPGVEGGVGALALGDGLRDVILVVLDAQADVARGLGRLLKLGQTRPAEALLRRNRAPRVEHPLNLLLETLGTRHVCRPFLCALRAHDCR